MKGHIVSDLRLPRVYFYILISIKKKLMANLKKL